MSPTFQEHILAAHQEELLGFIFRRVNCHETARDIFQDTYVRYTNYPEKNRIENHRAFIFRIAANLISDYERRNRTRERFSFDGDLALDTFPQSDNLQPESVLSVQEELELMAQAIEQLPPRCREVFILRRVKELSHAEIADQLGISLRMVEKHLHHALQALKKAIAQID